MSGVFDRILRGIGVATERGDRNRIIASRPFQPADARWFDSVEGSAAMSPTFGLWIDAVDVGYFDLSRSRRLPEVRLRGSHDLASIDDRVSVREAGEMPCRVDMEWLRMCIMSRDLRKVLDCVSNRHRQSMAIMLELSCADWDNLSTSLWSPLTAFGALRVMLWPTREGAHNVRSLPRIICR